jgi:hypothetical protein
MSKKMFPIIAPLILIAGMADAILTPSTPREIVISHKKHSKSGITHKQPKAGKNKPAKNYNSETKTWEK